MIQISENVDFLQPSATIAVSSRAKALISQGADVVNLTAGEPDFGTPDFIAEAGIRAIREGKTRYTPAAGMPDLRQAIASDLERQSPGCSVGPDRIVVSTGAKQALFNACFCLFGPGDRVLVPVPYWTTYPELIRLARAEPVFAHGQAGGKVTPADLDRAAADGPVAGLLFSSPSNPTGAVYSRDELEAVSRWTAKRDAWLISDEIYRRIYFEGDLAPGVLDLPPELCEKTVVIDGASKAFAMTGWRIGFSCSPPGLAAKMAALQSQTTSNPNTPAQYAALEAYRRPAEDAPEFAEMRRAFRSRRDLLLQLMAEALPEVHVVRPEGAFYLWIDISRLAREGEGSVEFAERLLQSTGLALVPGVAFGDDTRVRLSFAESEPVLRDAVERLASIR